jgi:carboxyl-terminal processing protease
MTYSLQRFCSLFIAAGFLMLCMLTIPAQAASTSNDTYRYLNLFGDVFERVRQEYVEDVSDEELIENAINGMLTALDPHSSYLNADSYKDIQVQTTGKFGGLGIEVTMENGLVKVISPIDDTPAFRSGIEAGDFITHLDDEPVLGLTISEAVERMRGKVGTKIKLSIRREGSDPFDVNVTRDVIKIRSVRNRLEDNVGYIRVTTFNEETDREVKKAVVKIQEESKDKELYGYVLDLRNNAGGLLDQAVSVSDAFLERGEVVSTRDRNLENVQRFNARSGDIVNGKPIVVLINGGSASAAEIVAGALQDHRRALVLGTPSFGKGSVQTIIPVPDHGAIRLTTARFYTPSGRSIQKQGIEPDIIIPQARVEKLEDNRRREADLRDALQEGEEGRKAGADDSTREIEDYQLVRAIDILKGLYLYDNRVTAVLKQ